VVSLLLCISVAGFTYRHELIALMIESNIRITEEDTDAAQKVAFQAVELFSHGDDEKLYDQFSATAKKRYSPSQFRTAAQNFRKTYDFPTVQATSIATVGINTINRDPHSQAHGLFVSFTLRVEAQSKKFICLILVEKDKGIWKLSDFTINPAP
jgi:hypothetical protein